MPSRAHPLPPGTVLPCIVGPTAVGKTAVASRLAGRLGAEVVSIDSMQIYRFMDIGTSKPTLEEMSLTRFHLIGVADPRENFSASAFKTLAVTAIGEILKRGLRPLLVGGSGLYLRAVIDDLDFAGTPHVMTHDHSLLADHELHALLVELDPVSAASIPPSNRRRVLRALEVAIAGNRLISQRQRSWEKYLSPYDPVIVGLDMDRALLYRLIDRRVDLMVASGLEDEVRSLYDAGVLKPGTTAGEALGYKQVLGFLKGSAGWEETVALIKRRTRNYAKRQLTWFRKDPRIKWFTVEGKATDSPERVRESLGKTAERVLEYLLVKLEN